MKALHWKIKGKGFDENHELAQKYYDKLSSLVDELAEILMMLGNAPKNLKTVVDEASNDQNEEYLLVSCENNQYYTEEQMMQAINQMLCHLIALYEEASKDESLPSDIKSKLDEHAYYFRLEAKYKGTNRSMTDDRTVQPVHVPEGPITIQPVKESKENVLAEGVREIFRKVKEQREKDKAYDKKYSEWRKKAKAEGKAFFPAFSKADVDEFFRLDTKSGVFVKYPNQLKNMYETAVKNVKTNNYIAEQMPIMKYWIQVYTPLYNQVVKK